jgi:hypothetical protein
MAAAALALAACTQTYYKDFAVEPQDRAYAGRAQYEDIKRFLLSRKLRTIMETKDLLVVEMEPQDTLQVRLLPNQKVEMTLARTTSGANFNETQVRRFQDGFERSLREETGHIVSIRLVAERERPLTNLGF